MTTKNYYVVHIAGMPANYKIFSTLREAKKYVVDNYPYFQARICGRLRKDNSPVSITYYFPNLGFKKTIKF